MPIISGGGTGSTAFSSVTTAPGATASITTGAGAIPSTGNVLEVWFVGRTTEAAAGSSVNFQFNGDTGANYVRQKLQANSSTVTGQAGVAQTVVDIVTHGAGGTAGYPGVIRFTIPAYAATTFNKVGEATAILPDGTAANEITVDYGFGWASTAAINQITVAAGSGTLVAGSQLICLLR